MADCWHLKDLYRLRGIMFKIQPEVRKAMPTRESCNDETVTKAMKFLCDEWLVDVKTDFAGKCTIIAAALSIIERSLLDQRAFFVTRGAEAAARPPR